MVWRWRNKIACPQQPLTCGFDCGELSLYIYLFIYFLLPQIKMRTQFDRQTLSNSLTPLIPSLRILIPHGLSSDTWAMRLGNFWMWHFFQSLPVTDAVTLSRRQLYPAWQSSHLAYIDHNWFKETHSTKVGHVKPWGWIGLHLIWSFKSLILKLVLDWFVKLSPVSCVCEVLGWRNLWPAFKNYNFYEQYFIL